MILDENINFILGCKFFDSQVFYIFHIPFSKEPKETEKNKRFSYVIDRQHGVSKRFI
jgi:hypothetical protein